VPKFGGQTFRQQIATVASHPNAKILTITQWNEWTAVRFPCDSWIPRCNSQTKLHHDGAAIFMDQYDHEYNRDLEPGGWSGAAYYGIMKNEISMLKGPPAAQPHGSIEGNIDEIRDNSIRGWACARGHAAPVDVHLYVGGPYTIGQGVGVFRADQPSEAAVNSICGSGTSHRFVIPLDANFRAAHAGKSIHLHGITPQPGLVHGLLRNSGMLKVAP
jgi:hypothetical protein